MITVKSIFNPLQRDKVQPQQDSWTTQKSWTPILWGAKTPCTSTCLLTLSCRDNHPFWCFSSRRGSWFIAVNGVVGFGKEYLLPRFHAADGSDPEDQLERPRRLVRNPAHNRRVCIEVLRQQKDGLDEVTPYPTSTYRQCLSVSASRNSWNPYPSAGWRWKLVLYPGLQASWTIIISAAASTCRRGPCPVTEPTLLFELACCVYRFAKTK